MATTPKKNLRKLVTLSPELAERLEKFKQASGAASESDAIKALMEDGLKLRDRRSDLFERCRDATFSGQTVGEVVSLITSDHPLVHGTSLDSEKLIVDLKQQPSGHSDRFVYSRDTQEWQWLRSEEDDRWYEVPTKPQASPPPRKSGLDDDIPF